MATVVTKYGGDFFSRLGFLGIKTLHSALRADMNNFKEIEQSHKDEKIELIRWRFENAR